MESKQEKAMSIVMLPYLAHGHVSPFYEIAKKLSNKGFHFYLCSTPVCLEPIRNNHFFDDHHPNKLSSSNKPAFDASKPVFSDILMTLRPDLTSKEIQAKYYNDGSNPSLAVFRPLVPFGPLVHKPQDHHDDEVDDDEKIMDWLSKKEPSSVVFVSFGSENFLSQGEVEEMAHGLELSNVDFIWVVRFHSGGNVKASMRPCLKASWRELMLDQPINAKLVVDMGVGMEVARKNKELVREEVAGVIRRVAMVKLVQLVHESKIHVTASKET
ncbi:hypothetical protein JRO89_XS15G0108600 [Xanthoceras sorbifolium]|uniref:Uncharacterized protein n=1 Tax=Xanthoceras sorbifolium TaxID=99658 RepID=A0ABQ8H1M3_9ROSI|nr:hypothetical protein JRO89_XS15G0108600 [Xanthoceras sorbifolium]